MTISSDVSESYGAIEFAGVVKLFRVTTTITMLGLPEKPTGSVFFA
jgi:hypothetical protein